LFVLMIWERETRLISEQHTDVRTYVHMYECMYVRMYLFTYVCLKSAILKNLTMSHMKYQRSEVVETELKNSNTGRWRTA
jgi:hypothetical protein